MLLRNFVNGHNLSSGEPTFVQVIQIKEGFSSGRAKNCMVMISDGIHCMDVMLSPHLIELVSKGSITIFSIILISDAAMMDTATGIGCVVLQMAVVHNASDVIEEPIYMKKRKVRVLSSVDESNQKKVRLHDAKTYFFDYLHNTLISATEEALGKFTTSNVTMCDNCNSLPCDWTEHGPGILQYLSDEHVGQYIDGDRQLYDEYDEGHDVVTNKNI
jgi:hypothetical protein